MLERMSRSQPHTHATGIAHHGRSDLEQPDADGCRASAFEFGAMQGRTAQLDHQRIGQSRQQQAELVALELVAAGARPNRSS
jgi:hypothetical protein